MAREFPLVKNRNIAIKALGTYEIPVKLHPKVTATLRVQVVEE